MTTTPSYSPPSVPAWLRAAPEPAPVTSGWIFAGPDPVGIDVETTGLDPVNDHLLEFAAVLLTRDLTFVDSFGSRVLGATEEQLSRMNPYVREMHTRTGLLDEVRSSTRTVLDLEDEVLAWLEGHDHLPADDPRDRDLIILGSSCRLDLAMIENKMPRLAKTMTHRMGDVSAFRELMTMWAPDLVPEWTPPEDPSSTAHRALDDVFTTIAEARGYRRMAAGAQPAYPLL